ncbi:MAG: enoyl-CoA hydratase-related protein [Thermoplasmata archaeon]|nr:enoyl-CoA hydratase-related protein [Thermoplasmata archaeon]
MADRMVTVKSDGDDVELIVLRNPPVNALSTTLLGDLDQAVAALPPTTRCAVVTGDGTYFSAGSDLKELPSISLDKAGDVIALGQSIFTRLEGVPFPTIAAINGLAVGGGLELALACDLRVAGDSAKLGAPEANYGLMPAFGGSQRLPRLIGLARAKELIFTGNMISATEALRLGLVNRMVPAGQELRAARDLAHLIASRAPRALRAAKHAISHGSSVPLSEGLAIERLAFLNDILTSEDLQEGVTAFLEHRKPKFTGK